MPTLREQIIPRRKLMLMVSESAIIFLVVFLGTSLPPLAAPGGDLSAFDPTHPGFGRGMLSCAIVMLLCQVSLSYNDLYDWRVSQNRAELLHRLVHSVGYAFVMIAAAVIVFPSLFHFPGLDSVSNRTMRLIAVVLIAFAVLYLWRACFHWFFYKWNFSERVLILGNGPRSKEIRQLIEDHRMAGFEVAAMVSEPPKQPEEKAAAENPNSLAKLAAEHGAARVLVALDERRGALPVSELLACRMVGITVEEAEAMYERLTGKVAVSSLRPSYLIFGSGFTKHPVAALIKRLIDIVVSLTGLVLASPLCVAVILVIKLTSRGPVFFRQPRVGQDGEVFDVVKFRTMTVDAEKGSGPVWASKNDSRVTKAGKILRLTRIDEIPQMFNVLRGNMSFVGPRPERPFFVEELAQRNPYYMLRHTVKPGLTGWAQVMHHYGASYDDAIEKLRYDLYYIKNLGPLFDLNIILRTGGVVLFGKGAR